MCVVEWNECVVFSRHRNSLNGYRLIDVVVFFLKRFLYLSFITLKHKECNVLKEDSKWPIRKATPSCKFCDLCFMSLFLIYPLIHHIVS